MFDIKILPILFGVVCSHMNNPQYIPAGGPPPPQQQYGMPQQQIQHGVPHPGAIHPPPPPPGAPHPAGSMLRDKNTVQDRAHIQEHLQELIGDGQDLSKMSEDELQFHYFKLHDNDDNNKLDGLELVKSLLHWHIEEHKHMNTNQNQQTQPPHQGGHETTKIFNDGELSAMIDPILEMDDANRDGFIDYPEFVNAQKQRGF